MSLGWVARDGLGVPWWSTDLIADDRRQYANGDCETTEADSSHAITIGDSKEIESFGCEAKSSEGKKERGECYDHRSETQHCGLQRR